MFFLQGEVTSQEHCYNSCALTLLSGGNGVAYLSHSSTVLLSELCLCVCRIFSLWFHWHCCQQADDEAMACNSSSFRCEYCCCQHAFFV